MGMCLQIEIKGRAEISKDDILQQLRSESDFYRRKSVADDMYGDKDQSGYPVLRYYTECNYTFGFYMVNRLANVLACLSFRDQNDIFMMVRDDGPAQYFAYKNCEESRIKRKDYRDMIIPEKTYISKEERSNDERG